MGGNIRRENQETVKEVNMCKCVKSEIALCGIIAQLCHSKSDRLDWRNTYKYSWTF